MNEPSGWTAIGISIVATIVAVLAVIASHRTSTRGNDLQARMLSLENARERDRRATGQQAKVVAFMAGTGSHERMFFRNEGADTARGINIHLDGKPLAEYQYVIPPDRPIGILGPRAEASVLFSNEMGGPDGVRVLVTWEDASGTPGRWETDLSL